MEIDKNIIGDEPQAKVSDEQGEKTSDDKVAYASFKRAVDEKKRFQAELNKVQDKLKLHEQDKAQNEGRKDDVINELRKELGETKKSLETKDKSYAYNVLSGQIKTEALKQGCVNPEKLIRLLDPSELKGIEVDEDFFVNTDDLQRLIGKAKEEHSDIGLFKNKHVNINDVTPSMIPNKSTNEMSSSELKEYARNNF